MFGQNYQPEAYDYDYVSLTETICDAVQKFYDLLGFDYVAWSEMYDTEKIAYVKLSKFAIDTEFDEELFHNEWVKRMVECNWRINKNYNKYRKWDNRLKKYKDLDREQQEFSKLYCAIAYALKDFFWEDE